MISTVQQKKPQQCVKETESGLRKLATSANLINSYLDQIEFQFNFFLQNNNENGMRRIIHEAEYYLQKIRYVNNRRPIILSEARSVTIKPLLGSYHLILSDLQFKLEEWKDNQMMKEFIVLDDPVIPDLHDFIILEKSTESYWSYLSKLIC